MSFKEFEHWYYKRINDKKWTKAEALRCTSVIIAVMSHPDWERNQIWNQMFENDITKDIINPINISLENRE